MNPLGFVYAKDKNKNDNAAVVALRIIQIYGHVDNKLNTLAALKKHSMGYGSS
jgi:hypothetical protein